MDLQRKGHTSGADGVNGFGDNFLQAGWTEHWQQETTAQVLESDRYFRQKTEVVGIAERTKPRKGVAIVQMKMDRFAYGSQMVDHFKNTGQSGSHGTVHRGNSGLLFGGLSFHGAEVFPWMSRGESRPELPDAHMADIDASTDPRQFADGGEKLTKCFGGQTGRAFKEHGGTSVKGLQKRIQVLSSPAKITRSPAHLCFVVKNQPIDAPGKA